MSINIFSILRITILLCADAATTTTTVAQLEPVDGRIGKGWNLYWQKLAQERNAPVGVPLVAALIMPPTSPPFYIELSQKQNGEIIAYSSSFASQPLSGRVDNIEIEQRSLPIEAKLADDIHKCWLVELLATKYTKDKQNYTMWDGTTIVLGGTDMEFPKFLMGEFRPEINPALIWIENVARLIREICYAESVTPSSSKKIRDALKNALGFQKR